MVALVRLSLAAGLVALAGCSALGPSADEGPGVVRTGLVTDLGARQPKPDVSGGPAANASAPGPGDSALAAFAPAEPSEGRSPLHLVTERDTAAAGDDASGARYRLNFENADLRNVIQAILGEALRINYVMSADVAGQVTISSPRAMTAEELLSALDTLLQSNGFGMTKTGSSMRIGALSTGGGPVDGGMRTTPGYGLSVVPLRHVSAATMAQLVSGFVVEADGLKVDTARNAMIVRGSGPKRQEAVQAIMSFDADWMQNQAVGIYEVRRATPEAVVNELNRVFDAQEKGVGVGAVQFKAISRLRAVMVVAKNQGLMRRAETWVKRLDRDSQAGGENVFVYKARYRDAKELARIMTSLFQAGGDGGRGAATTDPRAGTGASGSGTGSDVMSDNRSTSGSSSSSQSSSNGSFSNVSDRGGASSGQQQSGSAFNSPNFGDGSAGAETADAGAGETIDLSRQGGGDRPKVLISADAANNSVVTYADGYTYQKILAAMRQLDSVPLQVAIHATIAEVQLTDDMRNGVEYFVKSGNLGLGKNKGSFSLFGTAANTLAKQAPGFSLLVGTNSSPDVVISALDQVTNVEVLSSPSLVVAENQPANFQVGDEVPIITRQAQSVENVDSPLVNQVEYKNTGIILNVKPRIGQNDAVTLQIDQEISAVSGASSDTLTPTISKRRVSSNISVVSGQTVLLAGLISKRDERGKNGIPILGDIKGIGNLFSQRTSAKDRTELVVFIRPVVIRSGEDAQTVAEEFRSRLSMGGTRPAAFTK